MLEEELQGKFEKYMGNAGNVIGTSEVLPAATCLALAHWSLIFSDREFMVTDLQGTVSSLQFSVTVQVLFLLAFTIKPSPNCRISYCTTKTSHYMHELL